MGLAIALLLALFVLEPPWSWLAFAAGAAWEVGETVVLVRWSQRRRAEVGAETLVGRRAIVSADCRPEGQVRVAGELWQARCDGGAGVGDEVVIREVHGLLLVVEPR